MDQELSLKQLKSGRLAALRNAEELLSDAELLCEKGRWARSVFLSQIAVEELGKYTMFVSASFYAIAELINWKKFWRELRDHELKFGHVLLSGHFWDRVLLRGTEHSDKRTPPSQYLKDLPTEKKLNNSVKMYSLYSDFDNDDFACPSEYRRFEEIAPMLIATVKQRLKEQKWYENNVLNDDSLENLTKEEVFEMWRTAGIEDAMRERW